MKEEGLNRDCVMDEEKEKHIRKVFEELTNDIDNGHAHEDLSTEEKCLSWYNNAFDNIRELEEEQLSKHFSYDEQRFIRFCSSDCHRHVCDMMGKEKYSSVDYSDFQCEYSRREFED